MCFNSFGIKGEVGHRLIQAKTDIQAQKLDCIFIVRAFGNVPLLSSHKKSANALTLAFMFCPLDSEARSGHGSWA